MELLKNIEQYDQAESTKTDGWHSRLSINKNNEIRGNSMMNTQIIMENDPLLKDKFAYNEFSREPELAKGFTLLGLDFEAGTLPNKLDTTLMEYFEKKYRAVFSKNIVQDAIILACHKNTYNPVVEYFEACHGIWDQKPRLETALQDYLGAEDNEVTRKIARLFFVGAVMKAYTPTEKFDYVLDLVGGQGAGKTTFLQKLGGRWYTDNIQDFKSKDQFQMMLRYLIVNDDEMKATANSTFAQIKSFITQTELEFRAPYAARSEKHPKGFVIARTTNESTHLKDKTGDRRFLPVMVNQKKQKEHPVAGMEQGWVDQFWGEAVAMFKQGFDFHLEDEEAESLNLHREDFKYVDEYEDAIVLFLEAEFPSGYHASDDRFRKRAFFQHFLHTGKFSKDEYGDTRFSGDPKKRDFCTIREIALECFDHEAGKGRDTTATKIKNIMDNHPKWKYITNPRRGYKRIN